MIQMAISVFSATRPNPAKAAQPSAFFIILLLNAVSLFLLEVTKYMLQAALTTVQLQ
jgi:hypothetical protein